MARRIRFVVPVLAALAVPCCGRDPEAPAPVATPADPASPGPAAPGTPAPVKTGGPAGDVPEATREPFDPKEGDPATPQPQPAPSATPPAPGPAVPGAAAPPPPRVVVKRGIAPEIQSKLDAARAEIAAGRPGDAIAALRAAERAGGANADLRLAQARAFLAMAEHGLARGDDGFLIKGMVADAEMRWKEAVALDTTVTGAAVVRASILRFEENPDAAKETLLRQIDDVPDDGEAHALLGEMATAARDWEAADRHWTKAATLDPANGRARLQATLAKQWLRVPGTQVAEGYVEAVRLLPDDAEAAGLLAGLYGQDRPRAIELIRRALAVQPKASWLHLHLAVALQDSGDRPGARREYEETLRLRPEIAEAHGRFAELLEADGKPLDALREYADCVERSEADAAVRESDAMDRLLNSPDSPVARTVPLALRIRCYDAIVAKNPADGRFGNNAGFWFRDHGKDYERSLTYYLAGCRASPDDQDILNDTGLIYLFHLRDRKAQCLEYFDRVVSIVEEDGKAPIRGYWDTLENLCKYWFEEGQYARVIEIAKKRANPKAALDGRPYPSAVAARWADQAKRKLAEKK